MNFVYNHKQYNLCNYSICNCPIHCIFMPDICVRFYFSDLMWWFFNSIITVNHVVLVISYWSFSMLWLYDYIITTIVILINMIYPFMTCLSVYIDQYCYFFIIKNQHLWYRSINIVSIDVLSYDLFKCWYGSIYNT